MAIIRYRGGFPVLNNATRLCIALPGLLPEAGKSFPVLWLLADEGKAYNEYLRRMDIEAIARESGRAIVMPEGLHSDYEDMVRGLRWYSYISGALPERLRELFPLSGEPSDSVVFGFGMGGLGAVRLGLRMPGFASRFGAADTDLDVFKESEAHADPAYVHKLQTIYGDDFRSPEVLEKSDVFRLAEKTEFPPDIRLFLTPAASQAARASALKLGEGLKCPVRELSRAQDILRAFLGLPFESEEPSP